MDRAAQRVVVMTGATAGLGAHAARQIADETDSRLIIGARGDPHGTPAGAEVLALDLASLQSVRDFADEVVKTLDGSPVDVLVLNAGLQSPAGTRWSADGFELTFAVNHLAHYLLARLLLPHLADGGRLVITTSDTHDPAIAGPIAPRTLDPQELAHPSGSPGMRAYASSKLCNLMTAHSFAELDEVEARGISVVAFNPGLTGGTSLGRDASPTMQVVMRVLMRTVFRVAGLIRPEFVMGTADAAGRALADVALGRLTPPDDRLYISLVRSRPTYPDPSALARSHDAQDRLWRESATMVGIDA